MRAKSSVQLNNQIKIPSEDFVAKNGIRKLKPKGVTYYFNEIYFM